METQKRDRWGLVTAAVAALSLCAVGAFGYFTLYSSDDYMYALYLRGTFREFLDLLKAHYAERNGRTLVHMAAEVILHFGTGCFSPVCAAVCFAIPFLSARTRGLDRDRALIAAALFNAAFLALPTRALNQGFYWISAFCNYALPTAMLVLLLLTGLRSTEGDRLAPVLFPPLALLCGATTEQSGAVAAALTLWFAGRSLVKRRGRVSALLSLGTAVLGLCSIFLSPATRYRTGREIPLSSPGALLAACGEGMGEAARQIFDGWMIPAAIAALFLLTGLLAVRHRRRILWLFAVPALTSLAAIWLRTPLLREAVLALTLADAILLLLLGEEVPALLIFMGIGSTAVVLPTQSVDGRTVLPFCLDLMAAVSVLFAACPARISRWERTVPALVMAAAFLTAVPMARGYARNLRVERVNDENALIARETGVYNYCTAYDFNYTWTKGNSRFLDIFLEFKGLDPETTSLAEYWGGKRIAVYADGKEQIPAYRDWDGVTLFPIRLLEAFGGRIVFTGDDYSRMTVTLPWTEMSLAVGEGGETVFTASDGSVFTAECRNIENRILFEPDVFTDRFGLDITYSNSDDAYYVTRK